LRWSRGDRGTLIESVQRSPDAKPGLSSDVGVLRQRIYDLEAAIGCATKMVCRLARQLLPTDSFEDRKFCEEVEGRLDRVMDRKLTVWPGDLLDLRPETNDVKAEADCMAHGYAVCREICLATLAGWPAIQAIVSSRLGEHGPRPETALTELRDALVGVLAHNPHSGSCCTFDGEKAVIVTTESCRCPAYLKRARLAVWGAGHIHRPSPPSQTGSGT